MNETKARKVKTIYFLGGEAAVTDAVAKRLAANGVAVWEFPTLDALMKVKEPDGEIILVLDTDTIPQGQDIAGILESLNGRLGTRPDLVCLAHARDMGLRVQALRAGAIALHTTPVLPDELAAWLLERSGLGPIDPYRVLVVDDEPGAATFAVRMLERAGMKTRLVSDPLRVLDALDELHPDLLLMALNMSDASGMELASIVREHEEYTRVPIIFLSREARISKQLDVSRLGNCDFLPKPVDPQALVAGVKDRIQSMRALQNRLEARLDIDPASGLYGREIFLKLVDKAIAEQRIGEPGNGLLYIELDSPEGILGRIGSACEDTLIATVGRLIRSHMQPADTAARLDDHAFGLLARRKSDQDLWSLAEALREGFAALTEVGGAAGTVTVSIGIGHFRPPADDALTILSRAKKAGRKASLEGGNRVDLYVPVVPSAESPERDAHLAGLVTQALDGDGLELMYQPIVAMRKIPGKRYEALLRLRAPDGEYIPPFDFLPVARAHGLMRRIDRWVIERALNELDAQRDKHPGLRLFIHQTMESAAAQHWVLWLRDQIAKRDLIKMRPVLQFQYQDVSEQRELAAQRFAELRRFGVRVCVLQFEGTPAAVQLVEKLSVSMVKLAFNVLQTTDTPRLTELVRRLHGLKIGVIAAGIENPQTLAELWGCGVDFMQGIFLQRPAEDLSFDFSEAAIA